LNKKQQQQSTIEVFVY